MKNWDFFEKKKKLNDFFCECKLCFFILFMVNIISQKKRKKFFWCYSRWRQIIQTAPGFSRGLSPISCIAEKCKAYYIYRRMCDGYREECFRPECLQKAIYEMHTISFKTFFVWAFKIVVDSWKFSMLLLYILWDVWPIFMISGSVAFPPEQYTSPQFHPCHRIFDQDGHQDTPSPSLESRPCSLWFLVIP